MKEYEDINDCVMDDWKELQEEKEREIDNCLIMRIKKLKEQMKNLIQQVIGSCILAFIKNKREKQDEQTTYEKAEKYAISQKPDDEQAQLYIIDGYLKGTEELKEKLESVERARDYWKGSSFDWRHKCTSRKPFRVAVKAQKQLTKAKEILVKLLEEEKNNMYWEMNGSDKSLYYEVRKQAEQFLKDLEK